MCTSQSSRRLSAQNVGISHSGLVIWRVKDQLGIIYINSLCTLLTPSSALCVSHTLRFSVCVCMRSEWVKRVRTKNSFNANISLFRDESFMNALTTGETCTNGWSVEWRWWDHIPISCFFQRIHIHALHASTYNTWNGLLVDLKWKKKCRKQDAINCSSP